VAAGSLETGGVGGEVDGPVVGELSLVEVTGALATGAVSSAAAAPGRNASAAASVARGVTIRERTQITISYRAGS
jgi:hypothetical protein